MKISENGFQVDGVYYLESKNTRMNPIAIRIEFKKPDYIAWEDTGNGRILHAAKVIMDGRPIDFNTPMAPQKMPEQIEITSKNGEQFKLVKLTARIFNEQLKPVVARGSEMNFTRDEEVQNHYLRTDFYTTG